MDDIDKELLYKVANKYLDSKRQTVRQIGAALVEGIPLEDFPIVADRVIHVLENDDPGYYSYSRVLNEPAAKILADLRIKEGLDYMEEAIVRGGGRFGFKYKSLRDVLPIYGIHAEPYLEKFLENKELKAHSERKPWKQMVEKVQANQNPGELIALQEALQAGK